MSIVGYKVLARKYRPQHLEDVVGQDVAISILKEAINKNRLPHAILLHGIRGVGKTTLARIIARVLNCKGERAAPAEACGVCTSCVDALSERHLDIIEMDAASRTGVDDVRELVDSSRYRPVSGNYKVFIIDEVHMLSKNAFNALLKTLEEPSPSVKFIFATTEIEKIPDTVLSRCMRLDLKRIEAPEILLQLQTIVAKEAIVVDDESLRLIARAGDGSMRDSLSLLDQAIALSFATGEVTATMVADMLGLVDKKYLTKLIDLVFQGQAALVLELVGTLYKSGSEPLLLLQEVLRTLYGMVCLKVSPGSAQDIVWSKDDLQDYQQIIDRLDMPALLQCWHFLCKGYEEIKKNPLPQQALQMVFVRYCYVTTLPSFDANVKAPGSSDNGSANSYGNPGSSSENAPRSTATQSASALNVSPQTAIANTLPQSFAEVVALLKNHKEFLLATLLEREVRLAEFKPLELTLSFPIAKFPDLTHKLAKSLLKITGQQWIIQVSANATSQTLYEQYQQEKAEKLDTVKKLPFFKEFLRHFPNVTLDMEP